MRVLVIGATGEVGKHVILQLLKSHDIDSITALVRRSISSEDPRLTYRKINFDEQSQLKKDHFDVAISCLGTTMKTAGSKEAFVKVDYLYNIHFAQYAAKCGVNSFHLVSAIGADHGSSIFYNKVKGDTEREVKAVGFKHVFIYRPSLLDSDRSEQRLGERLGILIMRVLNPLFIGFLKKYRSIKVEKVAEGIVSRIGSTDDGIILSDRI